MADERFSSVLLVCADQIRADSILARLYDAGYGAIGPDPSAALALAIAAQTPTSMAIVASPPSGKRTAQQLAHELMRTWGLRSLLLHEPHSSGQEADWAVSAEAAARMKAILAPAA